MDAPKPNSLALLIMTTLLPILCIGAEKGDILRALCTSIETYDFRNAAIEGNGFEPSSHINHFRRMGQE